MAQFMASIPPMPRWIAIIRIFQAILAIIVVALTGFAASVFEYTYSGFGMAWFTFAWTVLFLAYIGCTPAVAPQVYNTWAHLGLEFLATLWWLVTWALLASEASVWDFWSGYDGLGDYIDSLLPGNTKSAIACAKASAGIGALEWILFITTLVYFGLSVYKNRLAGAANVAPAVAPVVPMAEEHKMNPIAMEQEISDPRYQQQTMA